MTLNGHIKFVLWPEGGSIKKHRTSVRASDSISSFRVVTLSYINIFFI